VLRRLRVRPRLRYLLLAVLAAGVAYVAVPALSAQRYMPGAVDFEQALPAAAPVGGPRAARRTLSAVDGSGRVSYRSPVVTAPERFDLVGLAREMRPTEIRARDDGDEWSDWIETANGDPVYLGGADQLQLRTRGWRPSGTLHYVNVSGTTTELGGLLTGVRRAINSAFISSSSLIAPEAQAAPTRPAIISRRDWGANLRRGGCAPRVRPDYGTVKAAVVHHTVTANTYSEAEAPSIVLGICRFHRNGNGWNDIGYNALVDRFGNIYAGRAGGLRKAVVGAQAQGFNSQTTGVASIGTHTTAPPAPAARAGIVNWLSWKLAAHEIKVRGKTTLTSAGGEASRYPAGRRVREKRIIGHRDVGLTECPGDALEQKLKKIRRQVRARMGADSQSPPTDPAAPPDGGVNPR
jgi:N-acetylmuramoyl-L-alanine amidase